MAPWRELQVHGLLRPPLWPPRTPVPRGRRVGRARWRAPGLGGGGEGDADCASRGALARAGEDFDEGPSEGRLVSDSPQEGGQGIGGGASWQAVGAALQSVGRNDQD